MSKNLHFEMSKNIDTIDNVLYGVQSDEIYEIENQKTISKFVAKIVTITNDCVILENTKNKKNYYVPKLALLYVVTLKIGTLVEVVQDLKLGKVSYEYKNLSNDIDNVF
jgi:hypothetical protein